MTLAAPAPPASPSRPAMAWIHGPKLDAALALAWVPFAVAAVAVAGNARHLQWFAAGVLLLSLAHQPITLAMVYGDPQQFAMRRRIFTWTPLVLATLVFVGLRIDFLLVAIIGGLWNTEHTLMQRYGITRIYRRKGGDNRSGRLDLLLLASWLLLILAWAVADPATAARIEALGLGTANERSLELLVDARPYAVVLLVAALGLAGAVGARWIKHERATGFSANPGVYRYLAATAALFVLAVVHPIAALLAWVGSHAVEYFIIVVTNLDKRYPDPHASSSTNAGASQVFLARAIRTPVGIVGFVAGFSGVLSALVLFMQEHASLNAYGMVFFCLGGLHIFYDGFIWKLRRPQVAESFSISASAP